MRRGYRCRGFEVVGVAPSFTSLSSNIKSRKTRKYGSETSGAHGAGIDAKSAVTDGPRFAKGVSSTQHKDGTLMPMSKFVHLPDGK